MGKTLYDSVKLYARTVWDKTKRGCKKFGLCCTGISPNTTRTPVLKTFSSPAAGCMERHVDVEDIDGIFSEVSSTVISGHAEVSCVEADMIKATNETKINDSLDYFKTEWSQTEVEPSETVDVLQNNTAAKAVEALEHTPEQKSDEEVSSSLPAWAVSAFEVGKKPQYDLQEDMRSCRAETRSASWEENARMKLEHLNSLSEFGGLKPAVLKQQSVDDLLYPCDRSGSSSHDDVKIEGPLWHNELSQGLGHDFSSSITYDSFQIIPYSKEETLPKNTILVPHGLRVQCQTASDIPEMLSIYSNRVECWKDIDFASIIIPSNLLKSNEEKLSFEIVKSVHDSTLYMDEGEWSVQTEDLSVAVVLDSYGTSLQHLMKEPCPPAVLADVKSLVLHTHNESNPGLMKPLQDELYSSEYPIQLHMSAQMMDTFMMVAESNTNRHLETCGMLCGLLVNRTYYVTALIIPKQEATSDTCLTTNEEEVFAVQNELSLLTLGSIHTHPTQSCFMSAIDVHTHYSYQALLLAAIAIVMAPADYSSKHGIFRLSTGGMTEMRNCKHSGFHSHRKPPDGRPMYELGRDVYMNPSVKFDMIDLRYI